MKTIIFYCLSLFGILNNPSDEKRSTICEVDTFCKTQNPENLVPTTFQLLAGNNQSNIFKKLVYHNGNYYVIGSSGNRASLHKFDDTGNIIWSREVNDTSSWNDIIVNESGNLLLVGSRDINAGLPKDVLVGVYDPNGNTLRLLSYDYGINEAYNSIVQNPLNSPSPFRFYVVGSINLTNNRNDDDVIVTTMDEWGSTAGGMRRKYGSLNIDDEFYAKITVYNPTLGHYALSGHIANNGTYVVIDGNGATTNLGRALGTNVRLYDLQRTQSGEFLAAGNFIGSPPKGRVFKISNIVGNTKAYESVIISALYQIIPVSSNSFYAIGGTFTAGTTKPVVMFFNDNGSTLSPFAGKYPQSGNDFTAAFMSKTGSNNFAYVDGRTNSTDGYGMQDGYLATHIGAFEDCGLDSLGGSFAQITLNPVIAQPNSSVETLKSPQEAFAVNLVYNAREICLNNCVVEFSTSNIDNCGNVQFTSFTNLPGTVSYCWDFGDIPPCGSTSATTSHNYNNPGTYQVCLMVANGTSSCQTCRNIVIELADHNPPNIQCPPNITVDCGESTLPVITGSPVVTDNLDPNPIVGYSEFIVQMTPCYKEILRDWSATDFCGNVIHCQQTIVQSDTKAPQISCPGAISLDCNSSLDPLNTGSPTVIQECQNTHTSTYSDNILSNGCPKHIQRIWTVSDACGNSTKCAQDIFLFDNTTPLITGCNRKFIEQGQNSIEGICSAELTISSPLVTDNCNDNPILLNNYNNTADASGIYPEGTTIITWTATDLCGNTATCQDTVCVLACNQCPDSCVTNVLNISTGFDPINNVLLNPLSVTSAWQLVTTPIVVSPYTPSIPAPTYVIWPNGAWANQAGSQWISAYPFADLEANNPDPQPAYTLQNCFCVCLDSSVVTIDLKILVDNTVMIDLCDDAGNVILNLASLTSGLDDDFMNVTSAIHTVVLDEGTYCIKAKLRNESSVAMGLNIVGSITGAGLIESVCCSQTNFITGHKYLDKKCDGKRDATDPPGIGWEIQLKDGVGNLIETKITDGAGFYTFQDIPIGTYTLCEVQKPGYLQNYPPSNTYTVNIVDQHTPIAFLDFGNCPLDTCCVNEEAFLIMASTPLDVIRDSCMICISHPCIGWCQRMMIDWGDGISSGYLKALVLLMHHIPINSQANTQFA
ncbi:MAG: PKD domain-containing protein [Saprospiraceae bacterium]|nr:PKD domain-containing protein [Saprospiraceae bacterium]